MVVRSRPEGGGQKQEAGCETDLHAKVVPRGDDVTLTLLEMMATPVLEQ
jgi:hypothetical protein